MLPLRNPLKFQIETKCDNMKLLKKVLVWVEKIYKGKQGFLGGLGPLYFFTFGKSVLFTKKTDTDDVTTVIKC